jgi:hypothetical protein
LKTKSSRALPFQNLADKLMAFKSGEISPKAAVQ